MKKSLPATRCCLLVCGLVLLAGCGGKQPPGEERLLKIGFQDEPKTLNIFNARDVWTSRVLGWFYESLYTREPITHEIVPWIAEEMPRFEGKSATVTLREGAQWDDGEPITAHDVVFTLKTIHEFKLPNQMPSIDPIAVKAVEGREELDVEALDDRTIRYGLKEACTPLFLEDTLLSFFVQKSRWEPIAAKARAAQRQASGQGEGDAAVALKHLLEHQVTKPETSGPFAFEQWERGSFALVKKNPRYFGTGRELAGKKVGPFYSGILFRKYETPDVAILALKKKEIDFYWWSIEPGLVEDLKKEPHLQVVQSPDNGFFYLAFNLRKPPFSDLTFRRAFAAVVNREFLVERVLQDLGEPAYTVVPPATEFWHNAETEKIGLGLSQQERVELAHKILRGGGYRVEKEGTGHKIYDPKGKPIPAFDILTPSADYDPVRAQSGVFIEEWAKQAGFPARSQPLQFRAIVERVTKERRFDAFILGWQLGLDPDYVRQFFHSDQDVPEGNNGPGYRNPEFDALADASAKECDREKRRQKIFEMQERVVSDVVYIPLFFRHKVEAYNKETFAGWFQDFGGISGSILYLAPI